MSIGDKLYLFAKHKQISILELERLSGITRGVISRARNKNGNISSDNVAKILDTFPDLNPEWLLINKGEMIINNYQNCEEPGGEYNSINITGNKNKKVKLKKTGSSDERLQQIIEEQEKIIKALQKQVGLYRDDFDKK